MAVKGSRGFPLQKVLFLGEPLWLGELVGDSPELLRKSPDVFSGCEGLGFKALPELPSEFLEGRPRNAKYGP